MTRLSHSRAALATKVAVGLLALLAACGGGGGGSTPPVTPPSNALIWGTGTWGSKQWSATANAQLATEPPASPAANPTNQDFVPQETSR